MSRDHCVLNMHKMAFECGHCGATKALAEADTEIRRVAKLGKAWGDLHESCPAPDGPKKRGGK